VKRLRPHAPKLGEIFSILSALETFLGLLDRKNHRDSLAIARNNFGFRE
jgi:hypothetical protein